MRTVLIPRQSRLKLVRHIFVILKLIFIGTDQAQAVTRIRAPSVIWIL